MNNQIIPTWKGNLISPAEGKTSVINAVPCAGPLKVTNKVTITDTKVRVPKSQSYTDAFKVQ